MSTLRYYRIASMLLRCVGAHLAPASIRRLITVALASLCAFAGVLGLAVVPSQAAVTHKYLAQITEVPASSGAPVTGKLGEISGMTVDSGDLYVTDFIEDSRTGRRVGRLDKFTASASGFVSQFPEISREPEVSEEYVSEHGMATGFATGEVYAPVFERVAGNPVNLVGVFGASGGLLATWSGADTPSKFFGVQPSVAVDNSTSLTDWAAGDVYVSNTNNAVGGGVVDVFKPEAGGKEKYVGQLPELEPKPGVHTRFSSPQQVVVDESNGDVLVLDDEQVSYATTTVAVVYEFEPTVPGEYAFVRELRGTPTSHFGVARDLAVDSGDGDIYVLTSEGPPGEVVSTGVDEFSSTGVYIGNLTGTPAGPFNRATSVAVDPSGNALDSASGDVYVGSLSGGVAVFGANAVIPEVATEPASSVRASSVTLNGTVDLDKGGAASCRFEWGTSTSLGGVAACEPEEVAEGGPGAVQVHAVVSGLAAHSTYFFRLRATNEADGESATSSIVEFATAGPTVQEPSASGVTSTSATLGAAVDPHGAPTTYYFQYGTSVSYGSSVPAPPGARIGSEGLQEVRVHLQGLAPGVTYHYRVVAVGEPNGEVVTTEGPDETFRTQGSATEVTQSDGRGWELVSPPNKQGAGFYGIGTEQGADIQAAADGSAITYTATAPVVPDPAGSRSVEMEQVFSTRHTAGGVSSWETADITTAHDEGPSQLAIGHSAEYKLFSPDLSLGLVEPVGNTPLPPLPVGSEKTSYLRKASGEYEALVTTANVPPGTRYGGNEETHGAVEFVSASPDLSHIVAKSAVALQEGDPAAGGLYEWAAGQWQLVSVLPGPNGEKTSEAALGYVGEATFGVVRSAISNDGSRVVWEHERHDYLRDMSSEETVQVDAPQEGQHPAGAASIYRTASGDDSRVFFTSNGRLTGNATTVEGQAGEDLYVFEVTSGEGEPLAGKLTDVTVDSNAGETADVQGVIGASEDGAYVYFVANGVLGDGAAHGAKPGDCEGSASAQRLCNLYVEHYDEATKSWGEPTFIATLTDADSPTWGGSECGSSCSNLKGLTARVSPNGQYLAFMSSRSLTGYENRDANSGVPDEEVFLYDAASGRLVCASCNPTGARPTGVTETFAKAPLWDEAANWEDRWVAGNIPGWTGKDLLNALYQSRYLSNDGRLFFDSSDALVPADVNGKVDVYEFEPAGQGSCVAPGYGQSASVVFDEGVGGCVGLISGGTSSQEAAFLDASESGGDVFFLSAQRLSPLDYDTSYDVYDAHECSTSVPCSPVPPLTPPACTTGDACKAAPTPQPAVFGAPSSETFSGAGNVVPATPAKPAVAKKKSTGPAGKLTNALKKCRQKPKRQRGACERLARKRYGAVKARHQKSLSSGARRQSERRA